MIPNRRWSVRTRLPWLIWLVALLSAALGLVLLSLNQGAPVGERWGPRGFPALFAATFTTVGALIVSRQPRNWIGWIFCWSGLMSGIQLLFEEYAIYTLLTAPGSLPAGVWVAWIQQWMWVPGTIPVWNLLLTLFPQGRLPSPQWRIVVVLSLTGAALVFYSRHPLPTPTEHPQPTSRLTNCPTN